MEFDAMNTLATMFPKSPRSTWKKHEPLIRTAQAWAIEQLVEELDDTHEIWTLAEVEQWLMAQALRLRTEKGEASR